MQDRARDVVRQVGDDVVRRRHDRRSGPGRARRPRSSRRRPASSSVGEPLAEERRQPAVELDGRHLGAGVEQARRSGSPSPGPISRTRLPGPGSASARIASRTSGSARKFWLKRVPRPEPGVLERPADDRRIDPTGLGARSAWPARAPSAAGERQRRARVEGQVGPLAGGEPARPGRADHRPVVRAQRRPRHDQRQARAPPPRRPAASAGRRSPRRRRRARSSARRSPRPPGSSCVTRTSTTASWKPHASSAMAASDSRASGSAAAAAPDRQALVGAGLVDRPAGGRLQAAEAEVVACRRATPAGTRHRGGVAASAARETAGPPGYGRPSSRPTLSNASPAASSTVWPRSRYVRWSRISTRNVWPPDTIRATSGNTGSWPSASPGSVQPGRVEVALEVVDPDERLVVDPGERLREVDPDEERAGEARAVGDGDARRRRRPSRRRRRGPGRGPARSSGDGPAPRPRARSRRSRRGARSGWRRRSRGSAGRRAITAIPVSSHDDSTARISGPSVAARAAVIGRASPAAARRDPAVDRAPRPARTGPSGAGPSSSAARSRSIRASQRRVAERLGRHDQGVLVVVAVVARPEADGPEAVLLVEPARRQVRQPDLERRLAGVAIAGEVEEREEQPLADPLAAPGRVDGERRDVGLVDHQPHPAVRHDPAVDPGDEVRREPVRHQLAAVGVLAATAS